MCSSLCISQRVWRMNSCVVSTSARQSLPIVQRILKLSTKSNAKADLSGNGDLSRTKDGVLTNGSKSDLRTSDPIEGELREDPALPSDKALSKTKAHDHTVIEKWWEPEGGTIVERRRENVSSVFDNSTKSWVEVPYDSWSGSPEKDLYNIRQQEAKKVKFSTIDRDDKINGAFLRMHRRQFKEMEKHYDEEEEKHKSIPLIVRRPMGTALALGGFSIILYALGLKGD